MYADQRGTKAVFRIEPEASCLLRAIEDSVGDIRLQLHDGGCECDIVFGQGTDGNSSVTHTEHDECESCACLVFRENGCVPKIQSAENGAIQIETFVGDQATVWNLMEDLQSRTEAVELVQITSDVGDGPDEDRADLDLSVLTEKQREALDVAIRAGYYCRPSETSLEDLATEFDISKQALGQRLARAEEKIMDQLWS